MDNIGVISHVKYPNEDHYIEWRPNDHIVIADSDTQEQGEWSLVDRIGRRNRTNSETMIFNPSTNSLSVKEKSPVKMKIVRAKLKDLASIDVLKYNTEIRFTLKDSRIHSQYFFQLRNCDSFLGALLTHNLIRPSSRNRRSYIINENTTAPLRNFDSLNLDDIKNSKSTGMFQDLFIKFADIIPTPSSEAPYIPPVQPPPKVLSSEEKNEDYEDLAENCLSPFEDQIKELEDKLPNRRQCSRGNPLTEQMWKEFINADGTISDVDKVKEIIFRGVSFSFF